MVGRSRIRQGIPTERRCLLCFRKPYVNYSRFVYICFVNISKEFYLSELELEPFSFAPMITPMTAPIMIIMNTMFANRFESSVMKNQSVMVCQKLVIQTTKITIAIRTTAIRPFFRPSGRSSSPLFPKEPTRIMKTRRITKDTARNGIICTIIPTACPKEITNRPTTRATIASICLFPSPRTFDFWRTAKTMVKISKNGRIVSTKMGCDRIVGPPVGGTAMSNCNERII